MDPHDDQEPSRHEVRQRILRPATPEERERHRQIRDQSQGELPELKQWARDAAARNPGRTPVGTVFSPSEAHVLQAIDHYAADHALAGRGAVVREALAQLLHIDIPRQPSEQR